MTEKRCTRCKVVKSVREFSPSRFQRDGRHSWCKPCQAEAARDRYAKSQNRELEDLTAGKDAVYDTFCRKCGAHLYLETDGHGGVIETDHTRWPHTCTEANHE